MKISKIKYEELFEFHDKIKHNENNIYYCISFNKRIFGYIIFNIKEFVELEYIYIKNEYRNSGIGSKLLNFSLYDMINLGYKKIIVKKYENYEEFFEKNNFILLKDRMILNNFVEEIENINTIIHLSKFSIIINIILSILKFLLGYIFSLNILIADSINSFSDLINSILIIIGANIDKKPSDEDHPLGHGKIEAIFSLITGVLVIIASINLLKDTVFKIIKKDFNINIDFYFGKIIYILIFLLFLKFIQYMYVNIYSKKINNPLINSLLLDYKSDIILSFIVILGLVLKKYILNSLDLVLTFFVLIYLIYQGYNIIKENAFILMDSQDENLLLNIKLITLEVKEIENIHDIYMFKVGQYVYVLADIRLNSNMDIDKAHKISQIAEKKLNLDIQK